MSLRRGGGEGLRIEGGEEYVEVGGVRRGGWVDLKI